MDIKVQDTNYYVVHGWMINQLGLKGNGLALYAIIYGFSQTTNQKCTASQSYLAEWVGCSRATVNSTLSNLEKSGLITKSSVTKGGVTYMEYTAIIQEDEGCQKSLQGGVKKFDRGCQKSLHNNIDNNKEDKKKERGGATGYDKIINKMVGDETLKPVVYEFIKMRKLIKKPLTDRALTQIINRLGKFSGGDVSLAIDILDQSIRYNWQDVYPLHDDEKTGKRKIIDEQESKPFNQEKEELSDKVY